MRCELVGCSNVIVLQGTRWGGAGAQYTYKIQNTNLQVTARLLIQVTEAGRCE